MYILIILLLVSSKCNKQTRPSFEKLPTSICSLLDSVFLFLIVIILSLLFFLLV
ncbi:hypothetical protein Lalb_Chr05g0216681 [Lupinus albus]|uniref:Uncharacterized protein n=1 Tax=Lupinus albus TaxID=3870 RepID=A0A6A4QJI4_LUPAL|nr:hypothetical protein Lalb_Chr05g0216681 [Lupinus albus]